MAAAGPFGCPSSCEELLAQLVAFDTVNPHFGGAPGGEAALLAHLEALAGHWHLETRRCAVPGGGENLLVRHETSRAGRWLLFESHLDTVGAAGMTVPPFALTAAGDRLHGRGACDTKGSGAAMLWALQEHARAANAGGRNVALLFTIDEEARMSGARAFAARELAEFVPRLDGVIVGEPTLLRPVTAHNGVIRWKTITRGRAAHSAVPANGRSAISAMLRVVDSLESRYVPTVTREHPLTGRAAMSVNVIRGGTQVNIIPDRCEIECDRRTVPGETAEAVLAARDAVLAGFEVEHADVVVIPPLADTGSAALLARVQRVLGRQGLDPTPRGAAYVTDASHYAAAGAPTIVLGPGDIAQAHTADEWIARDQLASAVALYRGLMAAD